MRLLNVETMTLAEFLEDEIPPYAILSHTWEEAEVTFQDMQSGDGTCEETAGWKKIERCCQQAAKDGLEYVWVDTCCIDKSSSAELQEAINSMFRWYETSSECYAYLSDVRTLPSETTQYLWRSDFRNAIWFSRGWTLQELLAPNSVRFFDQNWTEIGTKINLADIISRTTRIPAHTLRDTAYGIREALDTFSVAQKMSWASNRRTSRPEDIAYCLLGIFDVNMPLMYGEGSKAFQRLQEEIMKSSDDQSLLAWGLKTNIRRLWHVPLALGESPKDFSRCYPVISPGAFRPGDSFTMTQRGVQLSLPMIQPLHSIELLYCVLNCRQQEYTITPQTRGTGERVLAIPLFRVERMVNLVHNKRDEYCRLETRWAVWLPRECLGTARRRTIYIPRAIRQLGTASATIPVRIWAALPPDYFIAGIYPPEARPGNFLHRAIDDTGMCGRLVIHIANRQGPGFVITVRYTCQEQDATEKSWAPGKLPRHPSWKFPIRDVLLIRRDRQFIRDLVRLSIAEALHIESGSDSMDTGLENANLLYLGFDSLSIRALAMSLQTNTGLPIKPAHLFGCNTCSELERKLVRIIPTLLQNQSSQSQTNDTAPDPKRYTVTEVRSASSQVPQNASLLDIIADQELLSRLEREEDVGGPQVNITLIATGSNRFQLRCSADMGTCRMEFTYQS